MAEDKSLKQIRHQRIGVMDNAAVRTIKMIRPVCSQQGRGTNDQSLGCQREMNGARGWWVECEAKGHDPYGAESGNPSLSQVPLSIRINSGEGVARARQRKGFKTLEEAGYEPVCEYRNCSMPIKVNTIYGRYCNDREARLIAADVEKVVLEVHPDNRQEKEKQLRQLTIYADGRDH